MDDIKRNDDAFALRTGITTADLSVLGKVPLFAGLAADDMRNVLASSSIRRFPDHSTLFLEGEPADRCFVVMDGWVKLYRLCEDGHEVVISVVSPGESFAEAAIFDSKVFPVSAAAITDTRLLVVGGDTLLRELRNNMDFTFNMLGAMSRHLRASITAMHQISTMSSTERLADFLLGLCRAKDGEAKITLPLDKSLIAARLGMQPETFSRALGKLKKEGVTNRGHEVIISDVAALRKVIKHNTLGCR